MIVLCGTNRPEANSRKVAGNVFKRVSAELERRSKDVAHVGPAQYLDLADLQADIFNPAAYGEKPAWFIEKFQNPILAAKGLLIVTPEYNGSFPGVLKYFIDMLKFPESLQYLPVAVVGVAAGQFGALRAVEQLEMILHYRKVHLFGERLFVPAVHEVVKPDGSLGDLDERLANLADSFVDFVAKYRRP